VAYRDEWKLTVPGQAAMRALHEQLRGEIAKRFERSIPFPDELFDRWERAAHLGFGEGASIYDASYVLGDVTVGENTWIGPFTILDGSGGLRIGRNCSVSAGVQIYTHDTVQWALTGGHAAAEHAPVTIGEHTYIGPNAIISSGVTVGRQCVIGAGALVNQDVPDSRIALGVPARVVGKVEVEGSHARLIYDSDLP
jgi:acetyltransferase-like isoleucine patch superfamily enzyme